MDHSYSDRHYDPDLVALCGMMTRCLREDGVILIMDPRFNEKEMNRTFFSTLEKFFSKLHVEDAHQVEEHNIFHVPKVWLKMSWKKSQKNIDQIFVMIFFLWFYVFEIQPLCTMLCYVFMIILCFQSPFTILS